MSTLLRLDDYRRRPATVTFAPQEFRRLISLYSVRVARGEWRDYALDHRQGAAAFAVFRHTFDRPLYRIVKTAASAARQAKYAVFAGPRKLIEGRSLEEVLAVFDRQLTAVS